MENWLARLYTSPMRRRRSKHRLHCEGKQNALVAFRLPEELLVALDGAARALKLTRSALFRRIAERSLAEAIGQAVEVARSDSAHPTGRLKALRLLRGISLASLVRRMPADQLREVRREQKSQRRRPRLPVGHGTADVL